MNNKVIHPTPEQLELLRPFERWSFHLADFVNSNAVAKSAAQAFLRHVGANWVYLCTRNLIHILGMENVRSLRPPGGLLLASNHRSFFDQYALSCWLFHTSNLLKRIYFPVRSEFFYERPMGVMVSLIMSALAMYPPIFRHGSKRDFNRYSVQRMVQILQESGSVVGVHPEGTRNKGDDPYTLLKAQPGIGKLILDARPTVLPIFINGLCNDFAKQIKSNFDGSGTPIIIVFGNPLNLDAFYVKPNRLRTQKEVADHVVAEIGKLGHQERHYRSTLLDRPERGPVYL